MGKTPKSWNPTPKEIENGWSNSPKLLSELVTALNDEEYIEDESAFMETMDSILEILKSRYDITEITIHGKQSVEF